ncbi:hypothetical protein [Clostridium felsineum]|nr:hypothetical protein [Clostridium felsineum]
MHKHSRLKKVLFAGLAVMAVICVVISVKSGHYTTLAFYPGRPW